METPHHERVAADSSAPEGTLIFLHGIFGRGQNWRAFAKQLVGRRPDWAAELVDLRAHGESADLGPPDTVEAASDDLEALAQRLGPGPVVPVGHSFGGKVALCWLARAGRCFPAVWVIDAPPGPTDRTGPAWRVLRVLRGTPGPFAKRADAVAAMEAAGLSSAVAKWLAGNLVRGDAGLVWGIDPDRHERLLTAYTELDLWPALSGASADRIDVVKAEDSDTISEETANRLAATPGVALHRLSGDHLLHVTNPEGLLELFAAQLPAPR